VTRESLTKAMTARVPEGTEEINLKALAAGFDEAARLRERALG
jgi:Pyruvate/2-oxoacid:ferredoxin oxidoreductase gamma subunit